MSNTQQKEKDNHVLLTTSLIVIETLSTFILKHDKLLALQAQKFIDQKVNIKINSYIPYFDVYVSFRPEGILIDAEIAQEQNIDLDVRTTLIDLFKIFVLGNKRSIRNMRIAGDVTLKDEFRDLLLSFSLPKIILDLPQWFSQVEQDQSNLSSSKQRVLPLLDKIEQQRSTINTLNTEIKQYKNRIHHIQRQQKLLNVTLGTIIVILLVILVYNLI